MSDPTTLRQACLMYDSGDIESLQEHFEDVDALCDALVRAYLQNAIQVTEQDAEWALGKFVKPNTMRAMIDRLKSKTK